MATSKRVLKIVGCFCKQKKKKELRNTHAAKAVDIWSATSVSSLLLVGWVVGLSDRSKEGLPTAAKIR